MDGVDSRPTWWMRWKPFIWRFLVLEAALFILQPIAMLIASSLGDQSAYRLPFGFLDGSLCTYLYMRYSPRA